MPKFGSGNISLSVIEATVIMVKLMPIELFSVLSWVASSSGELGIEWLLYAVLDDCNVGVN